VDRRVTLVAADNDALVGRAAQLWLVADEARAGTRFPPDYVKEQSAGFIGMVREQHGAWLTVAVPDTDPDGDPGEIVGLVGGFPFDDTTAYLAWIAVAPTWWGTDTAWQLLQHAHDRAEQAGASSIRLWVHATNDRARRFYERAGWRTTGNTMLTPVDEHELLEYERSLGAQP